ncbi:DUF4180 domain-containing protein [Peribacillus frigoritolerans]|uniref:DUF4180 domain-containing protein n=1 Tax=Peribacillus frigoritolerans TaxID=450367 RepID=UPI003F845B9F
MKGTQSALDISKTGSSRIALNKKQFQKIFLAKYKTCRRILRKFANFHIEFAIIGDFSKTWIFILGFLLELTQL